jgi:hypothetical protein
MKESSLIISHNQNAGTIIAPASFSSEVLFTVIILLPQGTVVTISV